MHLTANKTKVVAVQFEFTAQEVDNLANALFDLLNSGPHIDGIHHIDTVRELEQLLSKTLFEVIGRSGNEG